MLTLLGKLVNTDSGSYDRDGVNLVGSIVRGEFEALGFVTEVHDGGDYGDHLSFEHPEAEDPAIIAVAHMDTVFPRGTAAERPFKVEGDRAYGPGVVDMKGSHVALLYALKALVQDGHGECLKHLKILFNSDEEVGSRSSRPLIERVAEGKKYALIMEPSRDNGTVVSARKGGGRYALQVEGRASHAGVAPEKGRNAIEVLARKVIKLHTLNDYENGVSVSVGLAEGGTAVNTIPPAASAQIDVRVSTMEQAEEVVKKMEAICAEEEMEGTRVTLSGHISRPPMMENEGTNELIGVMQEIGREMGVSIEAMKTGGGSDAAFTAAAGVPTIDGIGPIGGNAHSEDEFLYVPSLTERTCLLAETIRRLVENSD
ncbi:carboxypeptidase [Alteribacter lacisalsi]|uniref:Carboxypeptidase n=2 Tax=Alteribacter lacisalsi TaxID=2045244 RepID=A0A2W0HQV3_9BACI|nr:carboxypeptidase [Alteribacter lacisalsi]